MSPAFSAGMKTDLISGTLLLSNSSLDPPNLEIIPDFSDLNL
jgi:hypothetical protein